jgi:ABC-type branched-subunit amino acid transport system substrate-binding protein
MFVSPFFIFDDNIYSKQFQNTYKATFNAPPDFLAAQGFDAATLLSTALKQSNQSGDYVNAFKGIDLYQGLTGEITVSHNGELERKFKVVELGPVGLQAVTNAQRPIITNSGLTERGQYE